MGNLARLLILSAISTNAYSANNIAQFSDSIGGVDINTSNTQAYVFDTTDIASNNYSLQGSKIHIVKSGLYEVSYMVNWGTEDSKRRNIKTSILVNGVDQVGGESYGYARREDEARNTSNNANFYTELKAGDYIELIHVNNSSITNPATTLAGESWISIEFKESIYDVPKHCKEILDNNLNALDGVYTIDPDGEGGNPSFSAYCDMTTDDGGWTLLGTFPRTEPGGKARLSDYGNDADTTPDNPSVVGIYKGSLAEFSEAKEQVSCSSSTACKTAYGYQFNQTQLDMVRYSWAYSDLSDRSNGSANLPNCSTTYGSNSLEVTTCSAYDTSVRNDGVNGWQLDIHGLTRCWASRGTYNPATSIGSGTCDPDLEPNGTKWALLWFR